MSIFPRLQVIVDRLLWLERLLPTGVSCVQLRIKDRPYGQIRDEVRAAQELASSCGADLVVNDYWRLAIEFGCRWVHLGQEDIATADIGAIRRAGVGLGISTHDESECDRALSFGPDYIAFGPIYPTTLKRISCSAQGLGRIAVWKDRLGECPLVAIGGLTIERARAVLMAGADGVALSTGIIGAPDPLGQARLYMKLVQEEKAGASRVHSARTGCVQAKKESCV